MSKFSNKSMLDRRTRISYVAYRTSDIIGILIGLVLCVFGNNMSQNPVNESGEFVKSMYYTGNGIMIVGFILVIVFGVMLYNLYMGKDKLEDDLREKQRIREVMVENNLIKDPVEHDDDADDENTDEIDESVDEDK